MCGGDDATEEQEGEEDVRTRNDYRELMPVSTGMLLQAFSYKPGRVIAILRHGETPDPQSGTTADVSMPSFVARLVATVVWAGAIGLLGMWARSDEVQPRGGCRRHLIAMAAWFGAYLIVIGPIVR